MVGMKGYTHLSDQERELVLITALLSDLVELTLINCPFMAHRAIQGGQASKRFRDLRSDFSEVRGREHVKRASEIAAAGRHNVFMAGPPDAGKTMLAQ